MTKSISFISDASKPIKKEKTLSKKKSMPKERQQSPKSIIIEKDISSSSVGTLSDSIMNNAEQQEMVRSLGTQFREISNSYPKTELNENLTELSKNSSEDKIELGEKSEKYYKKFDFFYRRTAFRSMTEYYKGLFKPTLDKWREGERKSTKNFVQQFISKKVFAKQKHSEEYQKL
jgi:hypothetical protein